MDIAEANRPAAKSHAAHAAAAMRAGTMVANPAACVPFIPLYNIRRMEQHGMYFCFLSTGLNWKVGKLVGGPFHKRNSATTNLAI
jgi:hypothetical protein